VTNLRGGRGGVNVYSANGDAVATKRYTITGY
jgi:hypothetical protein